MNTYCRVNSWSCRVYMIFNFINFVVEHTWVSSATSVICPAIVFCPLKFHPLRENIFSLSGLFGRVSHCHSEASIVRLSVCLTFHLNCLFSCSSQLSLFFYLSESHTQWSYSLYIDCLNYS